MVKLQINFTQNISKGLKNFLETLLNILNFPAISADINIFAQSPLKGAFEEDIFLPI